jgi:hypothetical protein
MPNYDPSNFGTDVVNAFNDGDDLGLGLKHTIDAAMLHIASEAGVNGDGSKRRDWKYAAAEFHTPALTPAVASVPGTLLTLNCGPTTFVLIMWQAEVHNNGSSTSSIGPYIDGVAVSGAANTSSAAYKVLSGIVAVPVLAASNHDIELKINTTNAANEAYVQNAYLAAIALDITAP